MYIKYTYIFKEVKILYHQNFLFYEKNGVNVFFLSLLRKIILFYRVISSCVSVLVINELLSNYIILMIINLSSTKLDQVQNLIKT